MDPRLHLPIVCRRPYAGRVENGPSRGRAKQLCTNAAWRSEGHHRVHFWARGYCVSTVGLAEEVIREYIRKQEEDEKKQEKLELG